MKKKVINLSFYRFLYKDKEYEKIPDTILLKRLDYISKAIDSVSKNQEKRQELREEEKKVEVVDQDAFKTIYTIQIGSFIELERAQEQFNSSVQRLSMKELDYLRIEKVGKSYSVRLGNLKDYASAEKFLKVIKP